MKIAFFATKCTRGPLPSSLVVCKRELVAFKLIPSLLYKTLSFLCISYLGRWGLELFKSIKKL